MSHSSVLVAATVLERIASAVVLSIADRLLPLFDASPRRVALSPWFAPLMRWDAFHFHAIAWHGYTSENQWAFFPGTPFLIRLLRFGSSDGITQLLWPIALLVVACDTTRTLYTLSLHHFPSSPTLATLVSLLSLLPSSPATLHFAPCSEPFFTYLSYKGMLYAAKECWILATICFTLATTFRSNGILLSGYIIWSLVIQPFLDRKKTSALKIMYALFLTVVVTLPFAYHNYSAYSLFCSSSSPTHRPGWCDNFPPSIYTHVQSKYWNVGFLRYWTLSQIPNFLISAPPLALLLVFSWYHLVQGFLPLLRLKLLAPPAPDQQSKAQPNPSPFLTPTITPHVIHTVFLCVTLIFFSHTQIVLRLAAALPTLYWGAAWLFLEHAGSSTGKQWRWGRLWVGWSVIWGLISLGLWAAFLPPA
ncbi:GPI mannosyltransferase 2 [Hypsizygus marmoreus]|uniref:GPI mannosyltransferase 2 n=1 Tax=Hypsizygus marmoreus TaxID=39966 RepID=A0A369JZB2_HYPMA|nr:GPI mannosyltransferase 2 [Hypsizygus marmoreus]